MAKDNQVQMPSSQGGLVQYFDADSGVEIGPKTIIAAGAGFGVMTLMLNIPSVESWILAALLGA